MNCNELDSYIHEFLDDQLSRNKRDEIANHLASCRLCAIKVAELEQTDRALRSLDSAEPPPDFLLAVRRKIARQDGSPAESSPIELFWEALTRRFSWPMLPIGALAAAALVFALLTMVQSSRRQDRYQRAANERSSIPESLQEARSRNMESARTSKDEAGATTQIPAATPATVALPKFTNSLIAGDVFGVANSNQSSVETSGAPILLENTPPMAGATKAPDKSNTMVVLAKKLETALQSAKNDVAAIVTNHAPLPPETPPATDVGTLKPMEPLASLGPMPTNLPPGLQSGWLDLATRNFYLQVVKGTDPVAFVRGYLDERGKFKLLSTQVEGKVVELDARQVGARGTPGWLILSTQAFQPARAGLKPSFPYVEGYQDKQGDFHPTSRRIYKAAD